MPLAKQIVNLNEYDLTGTPEAFTETISALATKTEAEGHKGVLRYAFYVDVASGTAAANTVAERSDAPRPKVTVRPASSAPIKPVTTGTLPARSQWR